MTLRLWPFFGVIPCDLWLMTLAGSPELMTSTYDPGGRRWLMPLSFYLSAMTLTVDLVLMTLTADLELRTRASHLSLCDPGCRPWLMALAL